MFGRVKTARDDSDLPDAPDMDKINELCAEVVHHALSS